MLEYQKKLGSSMKSHVFRRKLSPTCTFAYIPSIQTYMHITYTWFLHYPPLIVSPLLRSLDSQYPRFSIWHHCIMSRSLTNNSEYSSPILGLLWNIFYGQLRFFFTCDVIKNIFWHNRQRFSPTICLWCSSFKGRVARMFNMVIHLAAQIVSVFLLILWYMYKHRTMHAR